MKKTNLKTKYSLKEIKDKINELSSDSDNFVIDNYGSEAADNGIYEENFSEFITNNTFNNFINWLFDLEK